MAVVVDLSVSGLAAVISEDVQLAVGDILEIHMYGCSTRGVARNITEADDGQRVGIEFAAFPPPGIEGSLRRFLSCRNASDK